MRIKIQVVLATLVVFCSLLSTANADTSSRRSRFRFNIGGAGINQNGLTQYTGALSWNPTIISVGPFGIDLIAEGIAAKVEPDDIFGIVSGGALLRINLGSRIALQGGGVYQWWTITDEKVFAPYAALSIYWNRSSFFQGFTMAYSMTEQTWGTAHIGRLQAIISL